MGSGDGVVDINSERGVRFAYQALLTKGLVRNLVEGLNALRLKEEWPNMMLDRLVRQLWEGRFLELSQRLRDYTSHHLKSSSIGFNRGQLRFLSFMCDLRAWSGRHSAITVVLPFARFAYHLCHSYGANWLMKNINHMPHSLYATSSCYLLKI